eukprot:756845-Hanusia_phi.AAC.2
MELCSQLLGRQPLQLLGELPGAQHLRALRVLAHASCCVDRVPVHAVEGSVKPNHCSCCRPAVQPDAECQSTPVDLELAGSLFELLRQGAHLLEVAPRILGLLHAAVEGLSDARARDDVPVAHVLVLVHARGLHGLVELLEDPVEEVEALIPQQRLELRLRLERAEHSDAARDLDAQELSILLDDGYDAKVGERREREQREMGERSAFSHIFYPRDIGCISANVERH